MSKEFGNAPNPQSNLYASATSSQPAASDVPSLAPTALASQPSTQHSVSSVVPTSHKRRSRLGEEESNLSAETAARYLRNFIIEFQDNRRRAQVSDSFRTRPSTCDEPRCRRSICRPRGRCESSTTLSCISASPRRFRRYRLDRKGAELG